MKLIITALAVCLLAGSALIVLDTLADVGSMSALEFAAAAGARSTRSPPCREQEKNAVPQLRMSVICEGLSCRFDARATTDNEGISAWHWTFGEGEATGPVVTHDFPSGGQYNVGVSAIDICGVAAHRNISVDVAVDRTDACEDCGFAQAAGRDRAMFPRGSKKQDVAPDVGRTSRRFSSGSALRSPSSDAEVDAQTAIEEGEPER